MPNQTIEGTWEEILQYAPHLTGQNVRLTILTSSPPSPQIAWADLVHDLAGAWADDFPDLGDIRAGVGQDILRESL
jgi:hypothetical protein